jgi:hypothetical protein
MNNGKYNTIEFKEKQAAKIDRLYGKRLNHTKICECCGSNFVFEGRIKTKSFEKAKFCSRKCANNRQTWWNNNATQYRTIAFQNWEKKCIICGFNKVLEVHHID